MALSRPGRESTPFEGRVRRIMGVDAHLMEHQSSSLNAVRTAQQCRRDGIDYVSLNLAVDGDGFGIEHRGLRHALTPGTLFFVDSAVPVEYRQSASHSISIFLPRSRVQDAIGDPRLVPVQLQTRTGIGAVLQSHMRMIMTHAGQMTPEQRVVVVSACVDMAMTTLQIARDGKADAQQFVGGLHEAARAMIERDCVDPQMDPASLAASLGCSRATLYRLFAREGESVAALIWNARLTRARRMIASPAFAGHSLADIAFKAGFTDQAGFNRMFKRHYGVTPGQARMRDAALRASSGPGQG